MVKAGSSLSGVDVSIFLTGDDATLQVENKSAISLSAPSVGGWASFNYHGSLKYDMTGVSYEELLDLWTDGLSRWRSSSGNKNYYLTNWWIEGYSKH